MAPSILLRGGTVLLHNEDSSHSAKKLDILISGATIKEVGADLSSTKENTQIIDCTNKLITPGFIDTHHHVWQSQLRGRHANDLFGSYLFSGNFTGSLFAPHDMYWGELSGALECIDAGTTTVVDHSHAVYSEEHARSTIAGLVASGIRGVWCLSQTHRVKNWNPKLELETDTLPPWFRDLVEKLPSEKPFTEGLIRPGIGLDFTSNMTKEVAIEMHEKAKKSGFKLFSYHHIRGDHGMSTLSQTTTCASTESNNHCSPRSDNSARAVWSARRGIPISFRPHQLSIRI